MRRPQDESSQGWHHRCGRGWYLSANSPPGRIETDRGPVVAETRLLWLEHFPVVAAHTVVSKMYAAMRRTFYWRNMYKEVDETVRHCTVCAKNRVTERKRTSFLKFFPASGPLEFFAMDIFVTTRF
jgi:hypothetical protein